MTTTVKTYRLFGQEILTITVKTKPKKKEPEGPVKGNSESSSIGFTNLAYDRYNENHVGDIL